MMIENKYTIEYINPDDDSGKTSSKTRHIGFILVGLGLAALAYFFITLPTKKMTHQPKVVISQQQPIKEKTVKAAISKLPSSTPAITEKVTNESASTKPLLSSKVTEKTNQASLAPNIKSFDRTKEEDKTAQASSQSEDLEKLKAQLLETQNRNKELATELDAQIMENMELAALLEDSLYKINKEDKSYIKELKKLEQNTVTVTTNTKNNKSLAVKKTVVTKLKEISAVEEKKNPQEVQNTNKLLPSINQPTVKKQNTKANQIDLSTTAQMNAIIANLNKNNSSSAQNNKQIPIEASKIKLQDNINHLINNKQENNVNKFQESLNDI